MPYGNLGFVPEVDTANQYAGLEFIPDSKPVVEQPSQKYSGLGFVEETTVSNKYESLGFLADPIVEEAPSTELELKPQPPKSFLDRVRGRITELYSPSKARAANIVAISEHLGKTPSEVEKDYDKITKELGLRQYPTTEELAQVGIGLGLGPAVAAAGIPVVLGGIAKFMAAKGFSERAALPAARMLYEKIMGGEARYEVTKLTDLLPEALKGPGTIAEYLIYGYGAKKFGDVLKKPRVRGELAGLRYRILKMIGVKQPTELVPLTNRQLADAVGRGKAARIRPEVFQKELVKRMAVEKPIPQPIPAIVPEITKPLEMTDEGGFVHLPTQQEFNQAISTIGAKFDVEYPFKKIGAGKTGLQVKTYISKLAGADDRANLTGTPST